MSRGHPQQYQNTRPRVASLILQLTRGARYPRRLVLHGHQGSALQSHGAPWWQCSKRAALLSLNLKSLNHHYRCIRIVLKYSD